MPSIKACALAGFAQAGGAEIVQHFAWPALGFKTEPKLLVEVLSPGAAAYDWGLKFSQYRRLAILEEYLLIDLDTRSTDCYRKGGDGLRVLHPFARGEPVALASVTLELSAGQLLAEVPEV